MPTPVDSGPYRLFQAIEDVLTVAMAGLGGVSSLRERIDIINAKLIVDGAPYSLDPVKAVRQQLNDDLLPDPTDCPLVIISTARPGAASYKPWGIQNQGVGTYRVPVVSYLSQPAIVTGKTIEEALSRQLNLWSEALYFAIHRGDGYGVWRHGADAIINCNLTSSTGSIYAVGDDGAAYAAKLEQMWEFTMDTQY